MLGLEQLFVQCAPSVAPATMRAIVKTESGGRLNTIGYLIRKQGASFKLTAQPKTAAQAINWAKWLIANGYEFDAGPAQVNSRNWKRFGLDAVKAFDPCESLRAGSEILTLEYRRAAKRYGPGQEALNAAISSYNTGNFQSGVSNGYVGKVHAAALSLRSIE